MLDQEEVEKRRKRMSEREREIGKDEFLKNEFDWMNGRRLKVGTDWLKLSLKIRQDQGHWGCGDDIMLHYIVRDEKMVKTL